MTITVKKNDNIDSEAFIDHMNKLISVRNYMVTMYSHPSVTKDLYKRLLMKVQYIDEKLMKLVFFVEPAFEIVEENKDDSL